MVTAVVAAAGQGKRMGRGINKVFIPLCSCPILLHSVRKMMLASEVTQVVVVAAANEVEKVQELLNKAGLTKPWKVVAGGAERQHSIANALKLIDVNVELVAVHDGARPLVDPNSISQVIAAARRYRAAVLAVPVKDTIKAADQGFIAENLDRSRLWAMQTPQVFDVALLKTAYEKAATDGFLGTDDASLVERLGVKTYIVEGSYANIKITTPEDLLFAEAMLGRGNE